MGFKFRKSIKLAPGVKLNVGKKSVGVSVGNKYGGVSINSKTGARTRVSVPRTGMSHTTKVGSSKSHTAVKSTVKAQRTQPETKLPTKSTSSQSTITTQPDKLAQYQKIIKKNNLTKKKAQSWKRLFTGLSIFMILLGVLLLSIDIIGILPIIIGIILAINSHTYGDIIKTCFK